MSKRGEWAVLLIATWLMLISAWLMWIEQDLSELVDRTKTWVLPESRGDLAAITGKADETK